MEKKFIGTGENLNLPLVDELEEKRSLLARNRRGTVLDFDTGGVHVDDVFN